MADTAFLSLLANTSSPRSFADVAASTSSTASSALLLPTASSIDMPLLSIDPILLAVAAPAPCAPVDADSSTSVVVAGGWSQPDLALPQQDAQSQCASDHWRVFNECYARGDIAYCTTHTTPEPPVAVPAGFTYLCPPMHPREVARRHALYRYGILKSTLPRAAFHHLSGLTRRLFGTAFCIISLVDDTYQWFASESGLGCASSGRDVSFCGHTLLSDPRDPDAVFTVLDATKDWRFRNNPVVVGPPNIRFYVGAKLIDPDSELPLGTLCIIDDKPWADFSDAHRRLLLDLRQLVLRELKLWREEKWTAVKEKMQDAVAEFTERSVARKDAPGEKEGFELATSMIMTTLKADLVALVQMHGGEEDGDDGVDDELATGGASVDMLAHASSSRIAADILVLGDVNSSTAIGSASPAFSASFSIDGPSTDLAVAAETWPPAFLEPACSSPNGALWQDVLEDEHPERPPSDLIPTIIKHMGGIRSGIAVPVYRVLGQRQFTVAGAKLIQGHDEEANAAHAPQQRPFAVLVAFWRDPRKIVEDMDRRFLQNFAVSLTALAQRSRVELANRSKSSFVNSISHELRTPLHGILAVVELLEDTRLSSSQRQFLRTIETCGKSLVSVVNHVLDLAKIEYGRMEVLGCPKPVDLWQLSQEVADAMSPTVRNGIQFGLKVVGGGNGSRWCVSDSGSLRQILINLIGNALKFTQMGRVDIHVEIPDDASYPAKRKVVFRVVDTGPGMSSPFQTKLCQPFSQEDPLSSGTGLGLAITRYLIQAMQGEFLVKSTLGVGSVFEVRIPVESLPQAERDQQQSAATVSELQVHQLLCGFNVAIFTNRFVSVDGTIPELIDWDSEETKRRVVQEIDGCFLGHCNVSITVNPHLRRDWPSKGYSHYGMVIIDEDSAWLRRALRIPGLRVLGIADIAGYEAMAKVREEAIIHRQLSKRFGSVARSLSRSFSHDQPKELNATRGSTPSELVEPPARCILIAKPVGPERILRALRELLGLDPPTFPEFDEDAIFEARGAEAAAMMRMMVETKDIETQTNTNIAECSPKLMRSIATTPVAERADPIRSARAVNSSCPRSRRGPQLPQIKQRVLTGRGQEVVIETVISFDRKSSSSRSAQSSDIAVESSEYSEESDATIERRLGKTKGSNRRSIHTDTTSEPQMPLSVQPPISAAASSVVPQQYGSTTHVPKFGLQTHVDSAAAAKGLDSTRSPVEGSLVPPPARGEINRPSATFETEKPMVLIVEDNRVNRDILVAFVRRMQLTYDLAENGLEAVQAFERRGTYGAILMDIQMPVMDGNEATIRIREIERKRDEETPCCIWALTGLASQDDEALIRRSGANSILTKPVSLKQLGVMFEKQWSELAAAKQSR